MCFSWIVDSHRKIPETAPVRRWRSLPDVVVMLQLSDTASPGTYCHAFFPAGLLRQRLRDEVVFLMAVLGIHRVAKEQQVRTRLMGTWARALADDIELTSRPPKTLQRAHQRWRLSHRPRRVIFLPINRPSGVIRLISLRGDALPLIAVGSKLAGEKA